MTKAVRRFVSAAAIGPIAVVGVFGTARQYRISRVRRERFVTPTFDRSTVPTFYATLVSGGRLTPTGNAGAERAPAVAWLRLWIYRDQSALRYFDDEDCTLCVDPWTNPQRKNWQ